MNTIDWHGIFIPSSSIYEMIIRCTLMYLALFILLRIFWRQAGSFLIADLLVIMIMADAAQSGLAGSAESITESLVLIATIMF